MKRGLIINGQLLRAIADLGHGDRLAVADCGLPVPKGIQKIDLALVRGVPSFQDVVRAIISEMVVQKAIVAEEMRVHNPRQYEFVHSALQGIPIEEVSHAKFKELLCDVKVVVRTGEATPYSNMIFEAGVDF
ncbi:MAG: D-ribose pyranase [Candidatus Bipolaricaulaceae bacterium]